MYIKTKKALHRLQFDAKFDRNENIWRHDTKWQNIHHEFAMLHRRIDFITSTFVKQCTRWYIAHNFNGIVEPNFNFSLHCQFFSNDTRTVFQAHLKINSLLVTIFFMVGHCVIWTIKSVTRFYYKFLFIVNGPFFSQSEILFIDLRFSFSLELNVNGSYSQNQWIFLQFCSVKMNSRKFLPILLPILIFLSLTWITEAGIGEFDQYLSSLKRNIIFVGFFFSNRYSKNWTTSSMSYLWFRDM